MAEFSAADVKELRDRSGAGVMECRRALEATGGNKDAAIKWLQDQGASKAAKRSDRETGQGMVESYIHGGRIGVLVEVNCESDFVARTDDFKGLAHDIAMQIAATSPKFVDPSELPAGSEDDPKEVCLLAQPFIKEPGRTVAEVMKDVIAKTGENIRVRRFARFELGAG